VSLNSKDFVIEPCKNEHLSQLVDLWKDALRRTNLNSSADSLEELWFENAYDGWVFALRLDLDLD